jgi:hypothetical protein
MMGYRTRRRDVEQIIGCRTFRTDSRKSLKNDAGRAG